MGKTGREERGEGLRLKAISRISSSPTSDRGGLKKEDCFVKPFPKTPLAAPSRGRGGVDYFVTPFPRHVKEESRDGRKLRMGMAVPANGGFGMKGMDDGAAGIS